MKRNFPPILHCMLLFIVIVSASGCMDQRCIDPDDFGFATFTVSARYSKEEISDQYGLAQVAPWRNSNYKVNGRPLTIVVRNWDNGSDYNIPQDVSAWCAWYGGGGEGDHLSRFCEYLQTCTFVGKMDDGEDDAMISNPPCLFKKGVGLYALIAERDSDPNITLASQSGPTGINFHLGVEPTGYELYDFSKSGQRRVAGGIIYDYDDDDALRHQYYGSELYFKILDKFYDDNNGQYQVIIKSGLINQSSDPIQYVTDLVTGFLFGSSENYGVIRQLFENIISNPSYKFVVSTILTLFVVFTALQYLSGNIEFTRSELISRIVKIAIVSALLNTTTSWDIFNKYLFVFFIDGVQQVLGFIQDAGSTGPGSPSILNLMMAPQTQAKLFSLLFMSPLGFIYIIIFFLALLFLLKIYLQATVIYLTALIAIGVIISMGPIFICFMLFGITRNLFENWLRQLTSYALQPIILFTGIIFISMIIRDEIYGSLGFQVCRYDIPKMDVELSEQAFGTAGSIFYWWMPTPMKGGEIAQNLVQIPVPVDHINSSGDFCEAYQCFEDRYPDLPFLDPGTDTRRITAFQNGEFVQLDGLFLIIVMIYMLHQFNTIAVSMASFISNTSGNKVDTSAIGGAAYRGIGPSSLDEWARAYITYNNIRNKALKFVGRQVINVGKLGVVTARTGAKTVTGTAKAIAHPMQSSRNAVQEAASAISYGVRNPLPASWSAIKGTYNLVAHPVDTLYGKSTAPEQLSFKEKMKKGAWVATGVASGFLTLGMAPAIYVAGKKIGATIKQPNEAIIAARGNSQIALAAKRPDISLGGGPIKAAEITPEQVNRKVIANKDQDANKYSRAKVDAREKKPNSGNVRSREVMLDYDVLRGLGALAKWLM